MTYVTVKKTNGDTVSLEDLAPRAVALDGAVQGPVMGDHQDRWSFDHHADCQRLITAATCEQVFTATKLGFKWAERDVHINDLDGDTILSLYVIDLAATGTAFSEKLPALVRAVGLVDAHGPAAHVLLSEEDRVLVNGFYQGVIYPTLGRNVQERFGEWDSLIEECHAKIHALLDGRLKMTKAPDEPVTVHATHRAGGLRLVLAECPGFGGFTKLYDEGYDVVILTTKAADDSWRYTIGKVSDLVPYPLGSQDSPGSLLEALNKLEPGWGGGSSVGGSPRLEGGVSSRLPSTRVFTEAVRLLGE
jgi:hypothetical protein